MSGKRRPTGLFKVLASKDVRDAVGFHPVGWPAAPAEPAVKKRKLSSGAEAGTAMSTRERMLPELAKYWAQRYRLFSMFDEGVQLDHEGWYSVTPESIAQHIAERCRSELIVDAFCGIGGNAIQFAFTCTRVIAIDHSPTRLAMAKHNAAVYGVDNIDWVLADVPTWLGEYASAVDRGEATPVDAVFMSPAWGGPAYSDSTSYPLSELNPLPAADLVAAARQLTPNLALFLPRNVDLDDVAALRQTPDEAIELEEAWMDAKFKAATVYLGSLVSTAS